MGPVSYRALVNEKVTNRNSKYRSKLCVLKDIVTLPLCGLSRKFASTQSSQLKIFVHMNYKSMSPQNDVDYELLGLLYVDDHDGNHDPTLIIFGVLRKV